MSGSLVSLSQLVGFGIISAVIITGWLLDRESRPANDQPTEAEQTLELLKRQTTLCCIVQSFPLLIVLALSVFGTVKHVSYF